MEGRAKANDAAVEAEAALPGGVDSGAVGAPELERPGVAELASVMSSAPGEAPTPVGAPAHDSQVQGASATPKVPTTVPPSPPQQGPPPPSAPVPASRTLPASVDGSEAGHQVIAVPGSEKSAATLLDDRSSRRHRHPKPS